MFYGIIISLYYFDNKTHNTPHIHAKYQDDEAVFSIETGQLIEGTLPAKKQKMVEVWMDIHREDLLADWDLAISGQALFKIDPLK